MTEPVATTVMSEGITLKEFFENTPPGKSAHIKNILRRIQGNNYLNLTAIQLHCETAECNGIRFFEPKENVLLRTNTRSQIFLTFGCRNCKKTTKTYAFWADLGEQETDNTLMKFGEAPPFGPPTPSRVITLIGAELS